MVEMYTLTPIMVQCLRNDLRKHHELYEYSRCSGYQLEELMVRAIKSDQKVAHSVKWAGPGHDDLADLIVKTNGIEVLLEIKSGKPVFLGTDNESVDISGHRLGRFKGEFERITEYLKGKVANYISTYYQLFEDERGRTHHYQLSYIPIDRLKPEDAQWQSEGKQWVHTNRFGVRLSIKPSMSWQVWWRIPTSQIEKAETIVIN